MRLILVLRGYQPNTSPDSIGGFQWSAKHEAYVWQGREFKPEEFNQIIDGVLDSNHDLWAHPVTVRAISSNHDNLVKARAVLAAQRTAKYTVPQLTILTQPSRAHSVWTEDATVVREQQLQPA